MKLKDLSGRKFGNLLVVKRADNKKNWTMYECLCDCGKTTVTYSTHIIRGNTKSCGCGHPKGETVYNYKGHGEITGNRWDQISKSAERSNRKYRRELEFTITIEYAWDLFLKQERRCALTGIGLFFSKKAYLNTASLDRIDNLRGYVEGNVQWVHKDINKMKNKFEQDYFIKMCCLVASTKGESCGS